MRKRRILSLLLAVAVMATMLIAVPLTASAEVIVSQNPTATNTDATDYVEWFFNGSSLDCSAEGFATAYRKVGGDVDQNLGVAPSMANKGYTNKSSATVNAEITVTTPHNSHAITSSSSTRIAVIKNSKSTTNGISINNAFVADKGYDSYNLIVTAGSNGVAGDLCIQVHDASNSNVISQCVLKTNAVESAPGYAIFSGLTTSNIYITFSDTDCTSYVQGRVYAFTLDYNIHSDEPSVKISPSEITAFDGGDPQTFTATIQNIENPTVEWTSDDNSNKIKIDNKQVQGNTATADITVNEGITDGKITITATATGDGDKSASDTCTVNILPPETEVTISGNGVMKVTLTKLDEEGSPDPAASPTVKVIKRDGSKGADGADKTVTVPFGKYKVEADVAEPYYSLKGDSIPDFEANAPEQELTIPTQEENKSENITSNDYSKLVGKVVWDFTDAPEEPDPEDYLYLEKDPETSVYSDNGEIYMNVLAAADASYTDTDGRGRSPKFDTYKQGTNAQFNGLTKITLPAAKGSVITIEGTLNASVETQDKGTLYLNAQENGAAEEHKLSVTGGKTTEYKYSGTENGYVTITSAGTHLNKITISTPPAFGETGFDSGYYYDGDESEANKRGVIRFFQGFVGQNVEDYGFVFIKDSGDTNTYYSKKLEAGTPKEFTQDEIEGFYGDIDNIESLQETIIAKGFVKIGGEYYFSDKTINGTVKNEKIDNYPAN